jgi:type 1 glutamine amidotransferase
VTVAALSLFGCGGDAPQVQSSVLDQRPRVLVFSKTQGFRHDSISGGIAAVRQLGESNGFAVDATEDPAQFTRERLNSYRVVIFLSTTGDVLNADQEEAFKNFIRAGGGFVGVHSAADTEYSWPWYGQLLGAWFLSHPPLQDATLRVIDSQHPSTRDLPSQWRRFDEWYDFQSHPGDVAHVLLSVDEASYQGGRMGSSHPISWAQEFDGGRSWYTAMGHTAETYADHTFRLHLLGGIRWAGRLP